MKSIIVRDSAVPGLKTAVEFWSEGTTDTTSPNHEALLHQKQAALLSDGSQGTAAGFFVFCPKPVDQITPLDVRAWTAYLTDMGLSETSIYNLVSKVSSFYNWLRQQPEFVHLTNPVLLARPKAPRAYQGQSTKSLTDDEVMALLAVVKEAAVDGSLTAKRDYALLRFYFATGKRRQEIISLKWGDLDFDENRIIVTARHKGGAYGAQEIRDLAVMSALLTYIYASNRDPETLADDAPLWLRHDNGAHGEAITSHGFVRMLKGYAAKAGIRDIHLHQTRHTVARWAGEELGDIAEVQTVLGHANAQTTRVYLQRIAVKKDKISEKIAARLKGL